jgi:queuine tRNA-ribosyltransferase
MSRSPFSERVAPEQSGNGHARRGLLTTVHGKIETPIFMPVGTAGTVKGILPRDLKEMGAQIILANTYHLWVRPGMEVIRSQGGLRPWMKWDGPLLTDSGGFQVFSLSELRKITNEGVHFQSHVDGAKLFMSPEVSIEIQETIGSSIMMQLDVCPALPATPETLDHAIEMSTAWAARCLAVRKADSGALFGIVQGGLDVARRLKHLEQLENMEVRDSQQNLQKFDGLALGGFSVGENPAQMAEALLQIAPKMPRNKARYLMGVGTPKDLLNGISAGIDMFDCVMPTRNARNGTLFTSNGAVHIKRAGFAKDTRPVDENCDCYTCKNFSSSYLRHLHNTKEILGSVLSTLHNLHFYLKLMQQAREAISEHKFESFRSQLLDRWRTNEEVLETPA